MKILNRILIALRPKKPPVLFSTDMYADLDDAEAMRKYWQDCRDRGDVHGVSKVEQAINAKQ